MLLILLHQLVHLGLIHQRVERVVNHHIRAKATVGKALHSLNAPKAIRAHSHGLVIRDIRRVHANLAADVGKKLFPDRVIEVEVAPKSGDAAVDALIAEARAQLTEIRRANDIIAEPQLSAQIDDIEATCRQLLSRLEEQPQMLSSLRTFLRYYLPTTLKLLNARAALEGEIASGRSAAIASRIRDAMAQVQSALHKQLDALNEYRFINLESEMDALADMLKSDGLTADNPNYASELTASSAKETSPVNPSSEADAGTSDDPFAGLFASSNTKATSPVSTSSQMGAGTTRGGTK